MVQLRIEMATYVRWRDLTGEPGTLEALRSELTALPMMQTVRACSLINLSLGTWRGSIDLDAHEELLRTFFSSKYANELNRLARNKRNARYTFHRQQLLFLIKEITANGIEGAEDAQNFNEGFAKCCLLANDLLDYGLAAAKGEEQITHLMAEILPTHEYRSHESFLRKVARTRIFIEETLSASEIKKSKEFMDIPTLFERVVGLTPREYSTMVLGTLTRYRELKLERFRSDRESFLISEGYFTGTDFAPEKVSTFFSDVSTELKDLKAVSSKTQRKNDFTFLRDRPILKSPNKKYFVMDTGFLTEKLEMGIFWRVHNDALTTGKERGQLHTLWGKMFHYYVTSLLAGVCEKRINRLLPNPPFKRTGEACDGIIVCGSVAIFMEFKGSMLTAKAKFSGSPKHLTDDLELKFVGTDENPKGVRQLANTLFKFGNKGNPEPISGLKRISKIIPLLIARDSSLSSPFVNRFLANKLRELYDRKLIRQTITPLLLLSIDELEELSPYLEDTRFDEILESKAREDPSQSFPFSAVHNKLLAEKPLKRNQSLTDRYDAVVDEACMDLFGRHFKRPDENTDP